MISITPRAVKRLKALITEHPEDPIVRVTLKDLEDHRLVFSISLESEVHPDDEAQQCDGLTVAIPGSSVARLDGVTLDYRENEGFKFLHPDPHQHDGQDGFNIFNLN